MIEAQKDLRKLNSLAVRSIAERFVALKDDAALADIAEQARSANLDIRVLGGGSNLVLSRQLPYWVIKMETRGVSVVSEDETHAIVSVKSGENWHDFVQWTITAGFSGLENLALIPGSVGACPVQNIGAYGVEVSDYIENVIAFNLAESERAEFSAAQCQFGYRESFFKQHENAYVITEVQFKLPKVFKPCLGYGPLKVLEAEKNLTAQQVFDRVVDIRMAKLPDPLDIPNAGSFFKNPTVSTETEMKLREQFDGLVSYAVADGYKLAAGWLIDQAGFRGKQNQQGVGCYQEQALVLVNTNGAFGDEVLAWADEVAAGVFKKFGVHLEREPRIW